MDNRELLDRIESLARENGELRAWIGQVTSELRDRLESPDTDECGRSAEEVAAIMDQHVVDTAEIAKMTREIGGYKADIAALKDYIEDKNKTIDSYLRVIEEKNKELGRLRSLETLIGGDLREQFDAAIHYIVELEYTIWALGPAAIKPSTPEIIAPIVKAFTKPSQQR